MRFAPPSRSLIICLPLLMSAIALCSMGNVLAENWPSWRGPKGDGISVETSLPAEFGPNKNMLWKLALPGPAGSSPVVWGEQIFLTSVDGQGQLLAISVGTDGQQLWQHVVAGGNQNVRGDEGNFASPSPVTDGEHVWFFFGNGELCCLTKNGKPVWQFNVESRYGKLDIQFGMSSTPVLLGDRLYMQLIHGEGDPKTTEACVVALEKTTGKEVWHVKRPSDGHSENEHSYASPVVYGSGADQVLLSHGCDYIVAHDLQTGKERWRCGGLNVKNNYDPTLRFVASPAIADDLVIVPSAKKGPVLGIKPSLAKGEFKPGDKAVLWSWERTPDVPTPVVYDGVVYLCMQDGNLNALDAKTGKEIYFERTHRQRHRASPVYADGKLYLSARDGKVTVVKAGRNFEILAENDFGEDLSASPAISNGRIYFRTFGHLWAIGQ
jgi:outer membrane protein assembly factor BamB